MCQWLYSFLIILLHKLYINEFLPCCCCYNSVLRAKPVIAFNLMALACDIVMPKTGCNSCVWLSLFSFKFFAKWHLCCSFSFATWNVIAIAAIFISQRSHSYNSETIIDYFILICFVFWFGCLLGFCCCLLVWGFFVLFVKEGYFIYLFSH